MLVLLRKTFFWDTFYVLYFSQLYTLQLQVYALVWILYLFWNKAPIVQLILKDGSACIYNTVGSKYRDPLLTLRGKPRYSLQWFYSERSGFYPLYLCQAEVFPQYLVNVSNRRIEWKEKPRWIKKTVPAMCRLFLDRMTFRCRREGKDRRKWRWSRKLWHEEQQQNRFDLKKTRHQAREQWRQQIGGFGNSDVNGIYLQTN